MGPSHLKPPVLLKEKRKARSENLTPSVMICGMLMKADIFSFDRHSGGVIYACRPAAFDHDAAANTGTYHSQGTGGTAGSLGTHYLPRPGSAGYGWRSRLY